MKNTTKKIEKLELFIFIDYNNNQIEKLNPLIQLKKRKLKINPMLDKIMSNIEKALLQFGTGCNCCQAITTTFGPDLGLNAQNSLKIGGAFGGGMSGLGNTCGAVSGALMIISLALRNDNPEDVENKDFVYEKGRKFLYKFTQSHGTVMCRDLTGVDMTKDDELEKAKENGVFEEKCPNFVKTAAKLLDEILEK